MDSIKLHLVLDQEGRLIAVKSAENLEGFLITAIDDKNIFKPYTCVASPEEDMAKIEYAYKIGVEQQEKAAAEASEASETPEVAK